jgi:hypothetical protein
LPRLDTLLTRAAALRIIIIREAMMKKAAFFPFFLLGLAISASALTWRAGSVEEALAQAKAEGKLLLIDFFTETG